MSSIAEIQMSASAGQDRTQAQPMVNGGIFQALLALWLLPAGKAPAPGTQLNADGQAPAFYPQPTGAAESEKTGAAAGGTGITARSKDTDLQPGFTDNEVLSMLQMYLGLLAIPGGNKEPKPDATLTCTPLGTGAVTTGAGSFKGQHVFPAPGEIPITFKTTAFSLHQEVNHGPSEAVLTGRGDTLLPTAANITLPANIRLIHAQPLAQLYQGKAGQEAAIPAVAKPVQGPSMMSGTTSIETDKVRFVIPGGSAVPFKLQDMISVGSGSGQRPAPGDLAHFPPGLQRIIYGESGTDRNLDPETGMLSQAPGDVDLEEIGNTGSRERLIDNLSSELIRPKAKGAEPPPQGKDVIGETVASGTKMFKTGEQPGVSTRLEWANVQDQIVQAGRLIKHEGWKQMDLKLQPESLGKILLQVAINNETLAIRMLVENQHVGRLLEENLTQMKQALQDQGLKLEQVTVQVGGGNPFGTGQHQSFGSTQWFAGNSSSNGKTADGWKSGEESDLPPLEEPFRRYQVDYLA
ncbi:MAG: flagellar hook-length control protein FliK [Bacillota bacterium]